MNKVYKFSKNILKMSVPLTVILGISSCATYQSSQQVESDGVYYNPSVDKTYAEVESQNNTNNSDIRVGSPYFDANGNGAEEIFYSDDTSENKSEKVNINIQGYNYGIMPLGTNLYTSLGNDSNWGRNDGVNITIYNNPFMWNRFGFGFGYGWNTWGVYSPWNWGFGNSYWGYDPYYSSMWGWGGFYGNNWGWNRPWHSGFYGGYYRPWNNGYYGGNWGYNRPYYNNGYYQNNIINSRPGNRPSRELVNIMSTGRDNILSRPSNTNRPTREIKNGNSESFNTNTTREVRPTRETTPSNRNSNESFNPSTTREVRPTRETTPSNRNTNGTFNPSTTREVRPTRETTPSNRNTSGTFNPSTTREVRPTRETTPSNSRQSSPTQQQRPQMQNRSFENRTPSYSAPSPRMSSPSSSMGSGSSSMGGSRSGGSGRR